MFYIACFAGIWFQVKKMKAVIIRHHTSSYVMLISYWVATKGKGGDWPRHHDIIMAQGGNRPWMSRPLPSPLIYTSQKMADTRMLIQTIENRPDDPLMSPPPPYLIWAPGVVYRSSLHASGTIASYGIHHNRSYYHWGRSSPSEYHWGCCVSCVPTSDGSSVQRDLIRMTCFLRERVVLCN